METWIQVITAVGFPIFACLAMGYFIKNQIDSYRADIKELQNDHKQEISKVTEALNNNTIALQKLVDKIEGGEN
jgi:hypothetical protein